MEKIKLNGQTKSKTTTKKPFTLMMQMTLEIAITACILAW